jgi:hypothetical protein
MMTTVLSTITRISRNFMAICQVADTEPIEILLSGGSVLAAWVFWNPDEPRVWTIIHDSPILLWFSDAGRSLLFTSLGSLFFLVGAIRLLAVLWPLSAWVRAHISLCGMFSWLFLATLVHGYGVGFTHALLFDSNTLLAFWVYLRQSRRMTIEAEMDNAPLDKSGYS